MEDVVVAKSGCIFGLLPMNAREGARIGKQTGFGPYTFIGGCPFARQSKSLPRLEQRRHRQSTASDFAPNPQLRRAVTVESANTDSSCRFSREKADGANGTSDSELFSPRR